MHVDVVIIGAGPAGGMAACGLAQTGLQVMLLEKHTLPRHKPCGGAMPKSVNTMMDWDITSLISNEICIRKNLYNYTLPKIVSAPGAPIVMVNRSRFDAHLIERAVKLGNGAVQVRTGFGVAHVEEHTHGVYIQGENQEVIQAHCVIAADGAFSRTAKCLNLNSNVNYGVAIDAEVEVTPEVYEAEKSCATFNFFCLPHGYGWIFPKDGYLSCGVGSWRGRLRVPKAMDDFLSRSLPPGSIRSIRQSGHPIPLYAGHRRLASRRTCLVGDAASLVDPIMGEGIRFALQSGVLAAEVVAGLLQAKVTSETRYAIPAWGEGDCRVYQTMIHQGMGRDLDALYRLVSPIFLEAPEFFYRKFVLEGQSYVKFSKQLAGHLRSFNTPPTPIVEHV